MKTFYLITSILFFWLNVQSQNSSGLVYNNQSNQIISVNGNISPTVFEVNYKKYKEIVNTSRKVITKEYRDALELVSLSLRDSIEASRNQKSSIYKKEALLEINMYVNNFLESKEDYEFKKEALMDAQKVSTKNSLGYILYADDETNIQYEDKFVILANKQSEIKKYLKRILVRIDDDLKALPKGEYTQLQEARKRLNTAKMYEIREGEVGVTNYETYSLGEALVNPQNQISGDFENLGRYYVLKTKVKDYDSYQLVSAIDVRAKKIKKENFLFKSSALLIRNSHTKNTYLIKSGLMRYNSMNKVAQHVNLH